MTAARKLQRVSLQGASSSAGATPTVQPVQHQPQQQTPRGQSSTTRRGQTARRSATRAVPFRGSPNRQAPLANRQQIRFGQQQRGPIGTQRYFPGSRGSQRGQQFGRPRGRGGPQHGFM